jgi:hypothetical protein
MHTFTIITRVFFLTVLCLHTKKYAYAFFLGEHFYILLWMSGCRVCQGKSIYWLSNSEQCKFYQHQSKKKQFSIGLLVSFTTLTKFVISITLLRFTSILVVLLTITFDYVSMYLLFCLLLVIENFLSFFVYLRFYMRENWFLFKSNRLIFSYRTVNKLKTPSLIDNL